MGQGIWKNFYIVMLLDFDGTFWRFLNWSYFKVKMLGTAELRPSNKKFFL